ncbi:MAG TPA: hypothetical protein DCS93_00665 [Microscillaceae bacterium]|nr:hypothetical protein [Microscillaceae bacterium]
MNLILSYSNKSKPAGDMLGNEYNLVGIFSIVLTSYPSSTFAQFQNQFNKYGLSVVKNHILLYDLRKIIGSLRLSETFTGIKGIILKKYSQVNNTKKVDVLKNNFFINMIQINSNEEGFSFLIQNRINVLIISPSKYPFFTRSYRSDIKIYCSRRVVTSCGESPLDSIIIL